MPAWPASEPRSKLISALVPSIAPVPCSRTTLPLPRTTMSRLTCAAPAFCVFVAAAETGSSWRALVVPASPQPAVTATAATTAHTAATAVLPRPNMRRIVVPDFARRRTTLAGEGRGDCYGRGSRPLRGAGRPREDVGPSLSGGTAAFWAAVLCRCFLYYSGRPRSVL